VPPTICPVPTHCPAHVTQCPPQVTHCPPHATQCPPFPTHCPVHFTQCPPHPTLEAVITVCGGAALCPLPQ